MGVRRAVEIASKEAAFTAKAVVTAKAVDAKKNNFRVYTLGPLVHNPKVLADLETLGIQSIDDSLFSACDSSAAVIIRAHGISPAVEKKLRDKGCRVVDATCPTVKKNQLKTRELIQDGYYLFLAGEKEHAEITGLLGYCEDAKQRAQQQVFCEVVGGVQQAKDAALKLFEKNKDVKTALLGQTTISKEEYAAIGEEIIKYFPDLKIINTICTAAGERQNALRELLLKTDAVIVAGGKESANTRCLYEIAKQSGKPCVLAENAQEIPAEFLRYNTAGLCAGASTPDSVIDEIENFLVKSHFT